MRIRETLCTIVAVSILGAGCSNTYQAFKSNQKLPNSGQSQVCTFFDETGRLPDGSLYVKSGVLLYLIDEYGHPISEGFHEITPIGDAYIGEQGSVKVLVNRRGRTISESFHSITPTLDGYIAKIGSFECLLDKNGRKISENFQTIIPTGDGYLAGRGSNTYKLGRDGRIIQK